MFAGASESEVVSTVISTAAGAAVSAVVSAAARAAVSSEITATAAAAGASVSFIVLHVVELWHLVWFGHVVFNWNVLFDDVWGWLLDCDLYGNWDVFVDLKKRWKEENCEIES